VEKTQISGQKTIPALEAFCPSGQRPRVRKHPPGQEYIPDQRSCSNITFSSFWPIGPQKRQPGSLAFSICNVAGSIRCEPEPYPMPWLFGFCNASEQTAPSLPMMLTPRVASLMTRLRIRSDGSRPLTLSGGRIVYLRNTMWKTGKYCQLQCHEPVCCGEGADPCLSLHSRLLSRHLLSLFVSRRFDKRKATSTISLAFQTQSNFSRFQ